MTWWASGDTTIGADLGVAGVSGDALIAMLADYLTWHLRAALAELRYADQDILVPAGPVVPAQRSPLAQAKEAAERNDAGLPLREYGELLSHLSTLDRQAISFSG